MASFPCDARSCTLEGILEKYSSPLDNFKGQIFKRTRQKQDDMDESCRLVACNSRHRATGAEEEDALQSGRKEKVEAG